MAGKEKKRLAIRIDEKIKTAFVKQAKAEGRSLSGWVIQTCKERLPKPIKTKPSSNAPTHNLPGYNFNAPFPVQEVTRVKTEPEDEE